MREAWLVARKDALVLLRDGRLRLSALLVLVLSLVAVAGGVADRTRAADERAEAQQAERERWLDQDDVNPHAAAHYGTFVFRPVEPLAAVDPGLLPYVGAALFLEAHQQQLSRYRPIDEATPLRRFGTLSPALCLQVLLPLWLVLLTYAAVAGERERGTARLLLAAGVSRGSLALGKVLGVAMPVMLVLAVPAVAGGGLLVGFSGAGLDAGVAVRAAWMAAAYLTYAGTWIGLGLAVSALARSSRQALALLLGAWLLGCVVAPPAVMVMAASAAPTPSTTAFQTSIDADREARPAWDVRVEAATERFLAGEELPPASNPEVVALIETEEDETAIFSRHFERLAQTHARQSEVYQWASFLSPMLAIQSASMGMAATDYAHTRHFHEAAADYRTQLLAALNGELAAFDSWKTFSTSGSRDLWARVPQFDYDTPPASWAVAGQRVSLTALVVWLTVAICAAVFGLTRITAS